MFYVSSLISSKNQCMVTDTSDGVTEIYSEKDLIRISKSIPYDIAGVRVINGRYSIIAVTNPAEMLFDELRAQFYGYFSRECYGSNEDYRTRVLSQSVIGVNGEYQNMMIVQIDTKKITTSSVLNGNG